MRNQAGATEAKQAPGPALRGVLFIAGSLGILYAVIAAFESYV